MKTAPRVIVTLPNFNGARTLREAIRSVLDQTYRDFRFILVDNGSTDDSLKVAATFRDDRMQIHRNESHQSQSGNFNTCARLAASSDYCTIMHADDMYEKNYLEKMVDAMKQHPDALMAHCDFRVIDLQGLEKKDFKYDLKRKFLDCRGEPFLKREPVEELSLLMRGDYIICPAVFYRTTLFDRAGFFDESYIGVEDWDLYLRVLLAGHKILYVPEKIFKYRVHPFNLTTHNRNRLIKYRENMALLKKTRRVAEERGLRVDCTDDDIETSTLKILLWDLKEDLLNRQLNEAQKKLAFARENIGSFQGSAAAFLIPLLIRGGLLGGILLDLLAKTYFFLQPASKTPV